MVRKTALQKKIGKLINIGHLCYIENDKFEEWGFNRNQIVVVVGAKALPLEEDPYTQRIKMLVGKVDGDTIDFSAKTLMVDPKSLRKVNPKLQKEWEAAQEEKVEAFEEQNATSDRL